MATIELAQLPVPAHLSRSGSPSVPSTNNQTLRRRRLPNIGYTQRNDSVPESLDKLEKFREIAFAIVALNASTMKALRDGWYDSPQVIDRCCDEYAPYLSETELSLVDSIVDSGGAHFEDEVLEYTNSMNFEQVKTCLLEPRTSKFYSQLVDVRIKKYRASQVHAALAARVDHGPIPEKFSYCNSYQDYVEHAVAEEFEQRNSLKYTINAARRLLSTIKAAVEGGHLQRSELDILKSKAAALQVHYPDATAALGDRQNDLFHPSTEDWWEPALATGGTNFPVNIARAYEGRSNAERSNLGFVIPAFCLLSCVPIALAWTHSDPTVGTIRDANFYQLVAGSVVQLLGLGTMIYPTVFHSKQGGPSWFWTWVLATVSLICTVLSIPFYILFPTAWSMLIAFTETLAQPLILLQII